MDATLEQAMADAGQTDESAGQEKEAATTFDELIEDDAGSEVSEQAEATTEEEESAEDADESTDADGADESDEEDEDPLSDEEKAQLKQATQERITKKINRAHAEKLEAIERADAAEQEREDLSAKVEELEASLEAVDVNQAAAASGVSDLFLVETEAALEARADEFQQGVDALDDWLDDNGRDDVMLLKGGTEFSYAQVKGRRRELQRMIERDVPKARKVLERRAGAQATAKKQYPNLFKRSSPEHVEMQRLLRTVPGLRAHPDAKLLIGRMIAGKAIEGKTSAPKAAKLKPTAPKPPNSAAPKAKAGVGSRQQHDPQKVRESGSWDDIL